MTGNLEKKTFGEVHYIDEHDARWIVESILKEKAILKFINFFNIQLDRRRYIDLLSSLKTVQELQSEILVPIFKQIFENTAQSVSASNIETVDIGRVGGVFISNHRDIVLDSALMNLMLHRNGFGFANAGIGDNLLMNDAVQIIFNMMKCFVIKRSLPGKQQVLFLRDLSEFINYCITEKRESIWIAQASGRAKDGDDRTNPAIMKMLSMSHREDPVERLLDLNLHTTACSYEWDPCDVYKAAELLVKERGEVYRKQPGEDMVSIHAGICEQKGGVHVAFNRLPSERIEACRGLSERELFAALAADIDRIIHQDYYLWPSNYVAADLLENTDVYSDHYSDDQKRFFEERMNQRLAKRFKNGAGIERARELFLAMYAKPVFNKAVM